jgi:hypothetical protein
MTDVMKGGAMGMIAVDHQWDGHAVDIVVMTLIQEGHVTHHRKETCPHDGLEVGQETELDCHAQTLGRYLGQSHGQSRGQSLHQVAVTGAAAASTVVARHHSLIVEIKTTVTFEYHRQDMLMRDLLVLVAVTMMRRDSA